MRDTLKKAMRLGLRALRMAPKQLEKEVHSFSRKTGLSPAFAKFLVKDLRHEVCVERKRVMSFALQEVKRGLRHGKRVLANARSATKKRKPVKRKRTRRKRRR